MRAVPVLLAVTGAAWEAEVVRRAERAAGVRIVRRCVDIADVLGAAGSGQARAVVLAEALPRLSSDAIAELHARGIVVLAVVGPGESGAEERLGRMGVERVLAADVSSNDFARAVVDAVESGPPTPAGRVFGGFVPPSKTTTEAEPIIGTGRLIAVWGPTGAPGRSTVAVGLAAELAAAGVATLLVDADVYGGVVGQMLGMLDEASGLAAAARSAGTGSLDATTLAQHAREVSPRLLVLTGLTRADRWTEVKPTALESVWSTARILAPCTVVDLGFCVEADEEISFDTVAPRRNGATLSTLESADELVVVGSADPIGLTRLIRAIHELRAVAPATSIRVVVNKARSGPLGGSPTEVATEALGRYAGVQPAAVLPFDQGACDTALLHGSTLVEAARSSRLRKSLAQLAGVLAADALK